MRLCPKMRHFIVGILYHIVFFNVNILPKKFSFVIDFTFDTGKTNVCENFEGLRYIFILLFLIGFVRKVHIL